MEYIAATESDVKEAIESLPNGKGNEFGEKNVTNILNTAYAFVGIVAVAFIIYGSIQYIISNGDPGKISKAKHTILYAVIGLIVVMLAAAVTFFIIQATAGAGAE